MIPLLKGINPAPQGKSVMGSHADAGYPKTSGLVHCITFGRCPGMASCSERLLQHTELGKNSEPEEI